MTREMEFTFSDKDFKNISNLVTENSGIVLPEHKKMLVYSRLAKRVRALGLPSFADYIRRLDADIARGNNTELLEVINAMTTNVTKFFRENHHFEALRSHLPELASRFGTVRIWSCASSSGEEPWSVAMVAAEAMKAHKNLKVEIHASDLDTTMIERTRAGVYKLPPKEVTDNPLMKRYLKQVGETEKQALHGEVGVYHVKSEIREMMKFSQVNLVKPLPGHMRAHIVFCRNVIIYFDKTSKIKLFNNLARLVPEGGLVMIGHSESLNGITDAFDSLGKTIYQRNEKPAPKASGQAAEKAGEQAGGGV